MAEDRRQPPWIQIVTAALIAASGGAYGTSELLYRSTARFDERARWEDEARAAIIARIAKLEDEQRALLVMVLHCGCEEKK